MRLLAMFGTLTLAASGVAQDDDRSTLVERLQSTARPLSLSVDGTRQQIDGPGADLLIEEAAASSLLLLGEMHGNRETPALTEALLRALQSHGYGVLAVEVGPFSAQLLEELAFAGVDEFASFLAAYPRHFPFFDWEEEVRMAVHAVADGVRLVGLDQEFIASARYHLDALVERAPDEDAVTVATELADRAWELYESALEDRAQGETFLSAESPETFARLRAAFAAADDDTLARIDALAESAQIYQLWSSGANYESNHRRIEWMKRELRMALAGTDQKLVLKFGNVHLGRGYSPLNQLDLGNLAAEAGPQRGADSLHVLVSALGRREENGGFREYSTQAPYLELFPRMDTANVFDLRALRPLVHESRFAVVEPTFTELIWRYDLLVMFPQIHPATPLVDDSVLNAPEPVAVNGLPLDDGADPSTSTDRALPADLVRARTARRADQGDVGAVAGAVPVLPR